ncbi:hypothetical protein [Streptomyces sp. RFCAC02]|uniref:hypothetical protein n=1 Tax=Streptomyces sp. RFCAC02 TaxID=2499143 RepID=UPI001F0DDA49|nr:hypothetical protein [Streptomyces sp. RFCAC02]
MGEPLPAQPGQRALGVPVGHETGEDAGAELGEELFLARVGVAQVGAETGVVRPVARLQDDGGEARAGDLAGHGGTTGARADDGHVSPQDCAVTGVAPHLDVLERHSRSLLAVLRARELPRRGRAGRPGWIPHGCLRRRAPDC